MLFCRRGLFSRREPNSDEDIHIDDFPRQPTENAACGGVVGFAVWLLYRELRGKASWEVFEKIILATFPTAYTNSDPFWI